MLMEIHVYDTYVKASDGRTMHFDVITGEKDHTKAITYGKEWLKSVGEGECGNDSKRVPVLPFPGCLAACGTGNQGERLLHPKDGRLLLNIFFLFLPSPAVS